MTPTNKLVTVPVEATEAMLEAAEAGSVTLESLVALAGADLPYWRALAKYHWSLMIAAAPPEPTPSLTPDERERVKAVLEPFAELARLLDEIDDYTPSRFPIIAVSPPLSNAPGAATVGDLRAARSLLADLTKEGK